MISIKGIRYLMELIKHTTPKNVIKNNEKSNLTFNWLRMGVHTLSLFPLLELAFLASMNQLTVNPIQFVEQFLGRAALNLLVLALAVTPLVTLTGWKKIGRHRRALGLYSFFYFSIHFITFAVVDYGFDIREIFRLTTEKPFIIVGSLAGLILMLLAITSFKFWMKYLGKKWKSLHKTVYLVGVLAILHYAWAIKGSVTTLSGDAVRPILMGIIVFILLFIRIPSIKRWIISIRPNFYLSK